VLPATGVSTPPVHLRATQRNPLERAYYQFLFGVHEKNLATYLQADFKGSGWSGNVGVRVVNTREDIVTYTQVNARPRVRSRPRCLSFIGIPVSHSYSDILPSANLKIDMARTSSRASRSRKP